MPVNQPSYHSKKEVVIKKQSVLEAFGYTTEDTLGSGSFAVVKSAFSSRHGRKVAIKIIRKKSAPEGYMEKFLPREISILRELKHPHMVCFLQSIETTNAMYVVMELAENGDLLSVLNRVKCIKEPQAGE